LSHIKSKNIQGLFDKKKGYRYSIGEKKLREEILSFIDELQESVLCKRLVNSRRVTTAGGAAIEDFSVSGIRSGMHCVVGIHTKGAAPVTVVSAKADLDKVTVEFSADPSTDHIVTILVTN